MPRQRAIDGDFASRARDERTALPRRAVASTKARARGGDGLEDIRRGRRRRARAERLLKSQPVNLRGVEVSLGLGERTRGKSSDGGRERERCGEHRGRDHHIDVRAQKARRRIKRRLRDYPAFMCVDRQRRENMRDYKIKIIT